MAHMICVILVVNGGSWDLIWGREGGRDVACFIKPHKIINNEKFGEETRNSNYQASKQKKLRKNKCVWKKIQLIEIVNLFILNYPFIYIYVSSITTISFSIRLTVCLFSI